MKFCAILNRESGTLKTADADQICKDLVSIFNARDHQLECRIVTGSELTDALESAFADKEFDGVIAAGGDGTISAAAAWAWKSGKPFGVLPGGTMNLFARALGLPLDVMEAAVAIAAGHPGRCDIASANGAPVLHQFSMGFHAEMVEERNGRPYSSRLGKIKASLLSALNIAQKPPSLPVEIEIDGTVLRERISSLAVSNNPYGEGHLPYADRLDSGRLGVYFAEPASAGVNIKMLADLTLGSIADNPNIRHAEAELVKVRLLGKRKAKAVIDGELGDMAREVEIRIHAGELPVLLPGDPEATS